MFAILISSNTTLLEAKTVTVMFVLENGFVFYKNVFEEEFSVYFTLDMGISTSDRNIISFPLSAVVLTLTYLC